MLPFILGTMGAIKGAAIAGGAANPVNPDRGAREPPAKAAADRAPTMSLSPMALVSPLTAMTNLGLNAIQTAAAVGGVVGAATVAASSGAGFRRGSLLWRRLRVETAPSRHSVPRFDIDIYGPSYRGVPVVLQGRPQEGKTTLLRTALPFWRTFGWNPLSYHGIYLNGRQAFGAKSAEAWATQQMFGTAYAAQSEVKKAITSYRDSQWWLSWLESLGLPFRPLPLFVIIDDFECLMMAFPETGLEWAEANLHHQASHLNTCSIYVVTSDAAVDTLQRLAPKMKHVRMAPKRARDWPPLSLYGQSLGEHEALFEDCARNIGCFLVARDKLAAGVLAREDVASFVSEFFAARRLHDEIHYPLKPHQSWIGAPIDLVRGRLRAGVEARLRALLRARAGSCRSSADGREAAEEEEEKEDCEEELGEIAAIVDVVRPALRRLDRHTLLLQSKRGWVKLLTNEHTARPGLSRSDASAVADILKTMVGGPMDTAAVAPSTPRHPQQASPHPPAE